MSESAAFEAGFAALSQFFIGDKTMEETLQRVADLTVEAVTVANFVGITMLVEGEPRTGVFTDRESPEIDQAQYEHDDGPCLESFRNGEIYRVDDTRTDGRWPAFRTACVDHGILSTMSLPLVVDDIAHGALNMYSRQVSAFGSEEIRISRAFVAQAAIVLANARAYWNARQLSANLAEALKNRAEIEQAKGIIMGATRCSADEAFERLVDQSQRENRKLRDVARALVEQTSRRLGRDSG